MADTVALLERLVAYDTVSSRSNLALAGWVADYLSDLGARVRLSHDDTGTKANVLASFGPARAGGVVLSGHSDVVPVEGQIWNSDPFRLTMRGSRLYGRGTADMKGFVAACLTAAPLFAEAKLERTVHLAISYDEEVGCYGIPRLITDLLASEGLPRLAIIGEPTGMRLGDRHRGFLGFRARFSGRAAHSSDPRAGANAVYSAAAFVGALKSMGGQIGQGTDRTTLNVGVITGGSAINIVPAFCEVLWEVRPAADADVDVFRANVDVELGRACPPAVTHETQLLTRVPPFAPTTDNVALSVARDLGGNDPTFAMPFGTEAGFFQEAGMPAVVCGPGFIAQAHQPDEWIDRSQLLRADAFLHRLAAWATQDVHR